VEWNRYLSHYQPFAKFLLYKSDMIWKWNKINKKCRITYPKLKLTNILKLKEHYSFTTILLHIPVCVLVEKTITLQGVCFVVDRWQ